MKNYIIQLLILISIWSCTDENKTGVIVDASIRSYGFDKLSSRTISFDFRGVEYSMSSNDNQKIYSRIFKNDSLKIIKDELVNNSGFKRYLDGEPITVEESWAKKYSNSVNSVLYFFQLPQGLNDPAVMKEHLGKKTISGETYEKIKVTFEKEGGGDDYQDIFVYWFNSKTKMMDFLAYSYLTDGGGIRFRQAINRRKVDDFTFQDYINYEPINSNTKLSDLDEAFEAGQLKELSRIINENIRVD
ncbi:MAG: hypothetical protein JXR07_09410 [Reichenbachiella sp.]